MSQILGIKFNDYGQVYYFASGPFVVREGQHVIVKTDQGMGLGKVILIRQAPQESEGAEAEGYKSIYRLANDKDMESVAENNALSRDAFKFCRRCITGHKLGMKLVDVEVFFDRSKMVFYFTAPGRIDFRELIKDLVREYRTRIELRQIGVRHETQMLGAIGNCGQICCCRRFMRKFVPVTIKMAKEQNLFLNPTKISGICGRLLCCLSFEQKGYEEFHRLCPRVGKKYTTAQGQLKVLRSNFFKKSLTVLDEGFNEQELSIDEWNEIVNKPPSEGAVADAKARNPRNSRGARRPGRPDRPPRDSGRGASPGDSGGPGPADRKEGGPANEPGGDNRDNNRDKQAAKGRSGKPARSGRPPRQARSEDSGSPDDKAKRSRRPRRRRRRPPKK